MSKSSEDYGWTIVTISDENVENICKRADELIQEAISDESVFALSLIIPYLNSINRLEKFVETVRDLPNWNVTTDRIESTNERLVRINYNLAEKSSSGENRVIWILGFGNFSCFAKTRQSPYTELAMTVKSKQFFKQKFRRFSLSKHHPESIDRDPKSKATDEGHLADIHLAKITDDINTDRKFWKGTQLRKRRILGISLDTDSERGYSDTQKTKARLTFVLPG